MSNGNWNMILSFNFYYAHPGQEDSVLKQRLRASDVRESIRVPRGRVLARTAGDSDLPDVIWEHHFEDVAGHHADMAVRAASPEFEAIRAGMRKLCRRFERPLFEICAATAAALTVPVPLARVVTLDWIFCAPSFAANALAVLDQHAKLYAQQGFDRGRLLRLITPGDDLPQLVWQHEHENAASHERIQAEIASHTELQAWPSAIKALAQSVERSVWKVA